MAVRVFILSLLLTFGAATPAVAAESSASATTTTVARSVPDDTINQFLPQDRSISDCISAVPKPGCGSEARGGWHQYLVAIALVLGLAFVGWRIIAGVRRTPNPR